MKCPHCNGEHPDNYQFCPITGQRIEPQFKACTNEDCPDFGKYILPLEAKFCPSCGRPIQEGAGYSQIVVVCSKAGSFIQIGWRTDEGGLIREKRIRLKKGENVISVEEYPALQYGFSFDRYSDKPEQIEDIILDGFDTSNITDMSDMFAGCSSLKSLDLSGFDTSNVTDMSYMFKGCSSLVSLDLSGFDTSNVTDMSHMFDDCESLKSLDLSGFDTSNVTDMAFMFSRCESLKSLDLSGFDTSNVTDMSCMFSGCNSL
ncbi:BspA family leucine-rich repeat surface protein [Marseilla massiliensis]|uniref:BspA family leucine-rich repeat surface protein n=1 Tax=Marseilla massiliensis TaxID=1841864 RepID=UPI00196135FD|nr:BspA family leucine-rich repeat surface protein [Marseilla massiliensis]